jgi:hypothetical protein
MIVCGVVLGFHIDAVRINAWRSRFDIPTAEWKEGHSNSSVLSKRWAFDPWSMPTFLGLGLMPTYRSRGARHGFRGGLLEQPFSFLLPANMINFGVTKVSVRAGLTACSLVQPILKLSSLHSAR